MSWKEPQWELLVKDPEVTLTCCFKLLEIRVSTLYVDVNIAKYIVLPKILSKGAH